jgi:hypothetical protein
VDAIREISHIEEDKGKTQLSLGIRNESVALKIKFKAKNGKEKITTKFSE